MQKAMEKGLDTQWSKGPGEKVVLPSDTFCPIPSPLCSPASPFVFCTLYFAVCSLHSVLAFPASVSLPDLPHSPVIGDALLDALLDAIASSTASPLRTATANSLATAYFTTIWHESTGEKLLLCSSWQQQGHERQMEWLAYVCLGQKPVARWPGPPSSRQGLIMAPIMALSSYPDRFCGRGLQMKLESGVYSLSVNTGSSGEDKEEKEKRRTNRSLVHSFTRCPWRTFLTTGFMLHRPGGENGQSSTFCRQSGACSHQSVARLSSEAERSKDAQEQTHGLTGPFLADRTFQKQR